MNTKQSRILIAIILVINLISCKGQQIYPLNADYEEVPNYSYLKDTNNELLPFIGIWKATFDNKEITIKVDKLDHHLIEYVNHKYYQDTLFIRYIIKSVQGIVVKSTMNLQVDQSGIESSTLFPNQVLTFSYDGGDCQYGWGRISLQLVDTHT